MWLLEGGGVIVRRGREKQAPRGRIVPLSLTGHRRQSELEGDNGKEREAEN